MQRRFSILVIIFCAAAALAAAGVEIIELTLHVGLGTFKPLAAEELEGNTLHAILAPKKAEPPKKAEKPRPAAANPASQSQPEPQVAKPAS